MSMVPLSVYDWVGEEESHMWNETVLHVRAWVQPSHWFRNHTACGAVRIH